MAEASTGRAFASLVHRDLLLAYRSRGELINPLLFFLLVTTLFPLAVGSDPQTLRAIAPGVIWVAALLAAFLSTDTLFRSDLDDGSLEQLVVSPQPLPVLALAKISGHWVSSALPLLVIAPLLGGMMQLPLQTIPALLLSLALGTPALSVIGAIGAALTVNLKRGGMLLALLVLPLYIPVLIFGASAVDAAAHGIPAGGQLLLLAAMSAFGVTLGPFAVAAGLRITLD